MRSEGRRVHGWKSLGKHQCDPSQRGSKAHCQLDLKRKTLQPPPTEQKNYLKKLPIPPGSLLMNNKRSPSQTTCGQ